MTTAGNVHTKSKKRILKGKLDEQKWVKYYVSAGFS